MKVPSFIVFLFILPLISTSQDLNFAKYLDTEDIIILNEKTDIIVTGSKAYLIDVQINKEIEYKINQADGISRIESLTLPEPFDPTFIPHTSDIRRNAADFTGVKVREFQATVEKPDGTQKTLDPEVMTVSERLYTEALGEAEKYEYHFNGLQEGDIFTLKYSYSFAFRDNWEKLFSTRIFFHSEFPKVSCDFSLSHSKWLEIDTFFVHLDPPVYREADNKKYYSWHMDKLPGCLLETAGRPYKELPQFIFSLKPYELIYEHWDSFIQEFIPLWLYMCHQREKDIRLAVIDNDIGAKDKDNLAYEKLAKHFIDRAGEDLSGVVRLNNFQQWMVDTVKYDDALSYYDNQENYMVARPGAKLYGGTIRDFAIESAYANMIMKLGLYFFTAYPCDKRFGEISYRYFAPLYNSDLMFAVILKNNMISMVIPRSQYDQYLSEELPFYYEDIPVLLIHTNDFGGYKTNMADSIRMTQTPASHLNENQRKTRGNISINLENGSATFNTRILLSGQYSTLCRPAYFDKAIDPTINPDYSHRVWEINGLKKVSSVNKRLEDVYFPFKASVECEYSGEGMVKREGSRAEINLSGMIYHTGYPDVEPDYRFLDFYPDFTGLDQYIYQLVFDKDVDLVADIQDISLDNDYFTYDFSVKQQSPTTISVMSYLVWKTPSIPAEEISAVYSLLEDIEKNKALRVRVDIH